MTVYNFFMLFGFSLIIFGCSPNNIFREPGIEQLGVESYLKKIIETEDYYIIDVRTPMEYKKNHLDSAINISFIGFNFNKEIEKLDSSKTVFIYCQTAHRSPYAAKRLKKKGFRKIVDLKDGYKAYMNKSNEEMESESDSNKTKINL